MASLTKVIAYVLVAFAVACAISIMVTKTPAARQKLRESSMENNGSNKTLPPEFERVKKFVVFAGYGRSGSSIIGALMDAHPHVVMAHEAKIFRGLIKNGKSISKASMYEGLYQKSAGDAALRRSDKKGYTLDLPGWWQGSCDEYVEVVGGKAAGSPTSIYAGNEAAFKATYRKLKKTLGVPIAVIHPVRNPFDIIATTTLYNLATQKQKGTKWWNNETLDGHDKRLQQEIEVFFRKVRNSHEMIEQVFGRENVLEVHNCDLVNDPKATMSRIFQFLEVDASEEFLDACAGKIFKSVSRSRDLVKWSPELLERVDTEMKKYKSLERYSFTSV